MRHVEAVGAAHMQHVRVRLIEHDGELVEGAHPGVGVPAEFVGERASLRGVAPADADNRRTEILQAPAVNAGDSAGTDDRRS